MVGGGVERVLQHVRWGRSDCERRPRPPLDADVVPARVRTGEVGGLNRLDAFISERGICAVVFKSERRERSARLRLGPAGGNGGAAGGWSSACYWLSSRACLGRRHASLGCRGWCCADAGRFCPVSALLASSRRVSLSPVSVVTVQLRADSSSVGGCCEGSCGCVLLSAESVSRAPKTVRPLFMAVFQEGDAPFFKLGALLEIWQFAPCTLARESTLASSCDLPKRRHALTR
eukprot:CAMPEP_0179985784 /NCGR_PEP_ID=MMETSP0984-20121128/1871_1 /TAXON_ID=483367 /ORGANISM="non described non described, Strain CCMP 2436" /LENGTH=231 /DNA_ID=CAMNT_0021904501 /DNA_START=146 /DNA_END=837 /DNA_ORIENTATION=-